MDNPLLEKLLKSNTQNTILAKPSDEEDITKLAMMATTIILLVQLTSLIYYLLPK